MLSGANEKGEVGQTMVACHVLWVTTMYRRGQGLVGCLVRLIDIHERWSWSRH